MKAAKVALSLDPSRLQKLDSLVAGRVLRLRSEAIEIARTEKIAGLEHTRLARECAKFDPIQEQQTADAGLLKEFSAWPEY